MKHITKRISLSVLSSSLSVNIRASAILAIHSLSTQFKHSFDLFDRPVATFDAIPELNDERFYAPIPFTFEWIPRESVDWTSDPTDPVEWTQ